MNRILSWLFLGASIGAGSLILWQANEIARLREECDHPQPCVRIFHLDPQAYRITMTEWHGKKRVK